MPAYQGMPSLKNEYIFFSFESMMEKLFSFIALVDGAVLIAAGSSCLPNQDCFIVAATGICILAALLGYCIFSAFVNYLEAKAHSQISSPLPSPLQVKMQKPLPLHSALPLKREKALPLSSAHNLPLSSSPNNPSRIQEIRVLP